MFHCTIPCRRRYSVTENDFYFRFAERCLYDYLENVARLEALRVELRALDALSSVRGLAYDGAPGGGEPYDAVSARLEKIERVEQNILFLERRTRPVEMLLADLSSSYVLEPARKEMLEILRLRYLHANTWGRVMESLQIGKTTFLRRRRELVDMAVRYLAADLK